MHKIIKTLTNDRQLRFDSVWKQPFSDLHMLQFAIYIIFVTDVFYFSGVQTGGGSSVVAQKAEERRKFNAVLCAKPQRYSALKEERWLGVNQAPYNDGDSEYKLLDGFYLVSIHCFSSGLWSCDNSMLVLCFNELNAYRSLKTLVLDNTLPGLKIRLQPPFRLWELRFRETKIG